jgi:hypothetical protein
VSRREEELRRIYLNGMRATQVIPR